MDIFELAKTVTDANFEELVLSQSIALEDIDRRDEGGHSSFYYVIREGSIKMTNLYWREHKAVLHTDKYTPFMLACFFGKLEVAKILQLEDSINERDIYGNTPLIDAAWNGHTDVMAWLLSNGADANAKNIHGDTALSVALRFNQLPAAELLLEQPNIQINTPNALSYEPLVLAVVRGHLDTASKLYETIIKPYLTTGILERENPILDKHYTENNTMLHMCAMTGNIEAVNWLLGRRANPHLRNSSGITPLVVAAMHGHTEVVAALIPLLKQHERSSLGDELDLVFMAAAKTGNEAIIDIALDHNKKNKRSCSSTLVQIMLLNGVLFGHWNIVEKALALEPSKKLKRLNKHYDYGNFAHNQNDTLAHAAAKTGRLDMMQQLVALGVRLDPVNDNSDGVLHYAVRSRNVDLVRWLCKQPHMHVNQKNDQGNSALHLAAQLGDLAVVRALLFHGADSALENKQKQTPEFLGEHDALLKNCFLKFRRKDLSGMGLSRLHAAAANPEDKAVLQVLPQAHDLTQLSEDGLTPVEVAANLGNLNPVVVLLLWQAKALKRDAQALAMEHCMHLEPKSTAYKTFIAAAAAIAAFPANRLSSLKATLDGLDGRDVAVRTRGDKHRLFLPVASTELDSPGAYTSEQRACAVYGAGVGGPA